MNFETARENMVKGQLSPNKVTHNALKARFADVPRELFVPPAMQGVAYADDEVEIGEGRFLMAPMVLARLIQALDVQAHHKVLVVAGSTGYSAAILAPLAGQVTLVEEQRVFTDVAQKALSDIGLEDVQVVSGKPELGAAKQAPFDRILLDAPAQEVPQKLFEQLAAGGRIACIVEGKDGVPEATILSKPSRTVMAEALFETGVRAFLPNFNKQEKFVF